MEEIRNAIRNRMAESFEFTATGNLKHFITSEDTTSSGNYIGSIEVEGKNFKIYMI